MNPQTESFRSPWDTKSFFLVLRWVAFVPVGFILSILLSILVLLSFTWMTENVGRMRIKDFLFSGYPLVVLFIAGAAAYCISTLTTFIAPKPKIGAIIYGALYVLYALSTLLSYYQQDNVSRIVAAIVVVGVAVGNILGVINAYSEADDLS